MQLCIQLQQYIHGTPVFLVEVLENLVFKTFHYGLNSYITRVRQIDFKWCTIMYAKSTTKFTSKFANEFHIYDFEIFTITYHSKSSINNQSLLCFVRNQEYG